MDIFFYFFFENTVDPDQLGSDEAIWLDSTLFSPLFVQLVHTYNWNAAG